MIDLNGKKILVTGGCGFIGSNFIQLVGNTYKNVSVDNIDKLGVGSFRCDHDEFIDGYYQFVHEDLTNFGFLSDYFKYNKYDVIFNFAAESHVDRSITNPSAFIRNNTLSVSNLLHAVAQTSPETKVIHVSTDEVYGHLGPDDPSFTESSPLAPRSPYAASKASSDLIVMAFKETYGLNVTVTRCCNNYGRYQYDEKFIPTVIKSLVARKKIPIYGNGTNVREWIHVDDHNKSILEIAELPSNIYNIGGGTELSNLELVKKIIQFQIGTIDAWENHVEYVEDRKGHDFRYSLTSEKYKRTFETTPFDQGLSETVKYYIRKFS